MNTSKFLVLGIALILSFQIASAMDLQLAPLDGSGFLQPDESFNYSFVFSDNYDCSSPIYTENQIVTTNQHGYAYVNLSIGDIASTSAYLCEYRNSTLKNVVTIPSMVARNITADYFIGDGSKLTGLAGGGDILGVTTNGNYLSGGALSGQVDLLLNETYLNSTITTIATGLGRDNSSFNQTLTDSLYYGISNPYTFWNDTFATFNKTYADTLYASISITGDNSSWNETYADTIYAVVGYGDDWNKTYADTLYATIGAGSDNESWNQTYADTLYYDISNPSTFWNATFALFNKTYADTLYADISVSGDNESWNKTYADTLYADISVTGGNASWNETYANTLYLTTGDEANLNVNSSNYWDSYDTANATWFENIAGVLSLKLSELSSYLDTWLGTKDTDDLTEGSTNLYDNRSWNESRADDKYALIGAGADNSSWNQTYADTLYADISVVDTNTNCSADDSCSGITYDSELSYYTDSDIDGNEAAFDGWDKNASNDFDGSWDSLTDIPAGFADGIDNQSTGGVDWTELTSIPAGFDDDIDNDTTYSDLSEFNNDVNFITNATMNKSVDWSDLSSVPSGLDDGDDDTTYSALSEFTNDEGYYNTESNLTDLLNDNYASISVTGDNSSWNETYADTLYAPVNYGDDWNKTYADTLYADIGVTGDNSSWNESYADTQYADISVVDTDTTYTAGTNLTLDGTEFQLDTTGLKAWLDTLYSTIGSAFSGSWNDLTDVPAGFSDGVDNDTTYSDLSEFNNDVGYFDEESDLTTLLDDNYADIGVTGDNSSWNESYADTQYADISVVNTDDQTCAEVDGCVENAITDGNTNWDNSYGFWNDTYATFNKTYADTLYADIGITGDNSSWNQTYADTLYADISVVDTNVLTDATFNATQMEDNGGTLNILESWLSTLFDTLFGAKDSDDLTEGSVNLYDNQSWNESWADTQYADISVTGDNSSWNQTYADTLYYNEESDLTTLLDDNYAPVNYGDDWNKTYGDTLYEPISSHFDASTTVNITCINTACDWYFNATDNCEYGPNLGKECWVT